MNPARALFVSIPILIAAALALESACSDAEPPSASYGAGAAVPPPAAQTNGAAIVDADTGDTSDEEIGPSLCLEIEQRSRDVEEYPVPGKAPTATGGTIEVGVYVLNELARYDDAKPDAGSDPPPPGPTGVLARSTLYVTGKTVRILDARGTNGGPLPADDARAFTYTRNGTKLELVGVCPTQAHVTRSYSFRGNLLTFHLDDEHTEVYRILR